MWLQHFPYKRSGICCSTLEVIPPHAVALWWHSCSNVAALKRQSLDTVITTPPQTHDNDTVDSRHYHDKTTIGSPHYRDSHATDSPPSHHPHITPATFSMVPQYSHHFNIVKYISYIDGSIEFSFCLFFLRRRGSLICNLSQVGSRSTSTFQVERANTVFKSNVPTPVVLFQQCACPNISFRTSYSDKYKR